MARMAAERPPVSVLVAGLGNVLCGDDAIGPTLIHYLRARYAFPPEVQLEDLGTPGIDLARHLAGYEVTIIIDAIEDPSSPPGTLRVIQDLAPVHSSTSLHAPTIGEALRLVPLYGAPPRLVALFGISCHSFDLGESPSPALRARVDGLTEEIAALLPRFGVHPTALDIASLPVPWWSTSAWSSR